LSSFFFLDPATTETYTLSLHDALPIYYLRHAADELKKLAPRDGEETALAERRTTMMQGEKIAADLREAQDAVGGTHSPVPALSAAVRRLERRAANSPALVEPAGKAIDAAINAREE